MAEELNRTAQADEAGDVDTSAPPANPPGYQLIAEIGRGGVGVVYRARDLALDRDVAVKLLSQRYPPDSLPAQHFLAPGRRGRRPLPGAVATMTWLALRASMTA